MPDINNMRMNYLRDLAEDHGVPLKKVLLLADLLGSEEDFDGLVSMVQDLAEMQD